jgi:hypothetical protein
MTDLTKNYCLGGTMLVMGGIILVGWPSGLSPEWHSRKLEVCDYFQVLLNLLSSILVCGRHILH